MALGETEKAKKVKIVNITAVPGAAINNVYGLGDDGNVYMWAISTGKWYLYTYTNSETKTRVNRGKKDETRN